MRRIMKAELYRLRKTGIFYFLILFAAASVIVPFIADVSKGIITSQSDIFIVLVFMTRYPELLIVFAVFLSLAVSGMYKCGMNNNEIINGFSPHKIIISRLIVYSVSVISAFMIPGILICLYFFINDIYTGTGQKITEFIKYFTVALIILLNYVFTTVLITMIIKKRALSAAASVIYLVPGILCEIFSTGLPSAERYDLLNIITIFGYCFSLYQCSLFPIISRYNGYDIDHNIIIRSIDGGKVMIISFILNTILLYSILYFRSRSEENS